MQRLYQLNFGKRPADELYVLADDPNQVKNLANDPKFASIKSKIADQLTGALIQLNDPRETNAAIKFDDYPYTGGVPTYPGDEAVDLYRDDR